MGCIDQTSIFRQRVTELSRAYPPADPKRSKAKAHRNTKPSEDATDDGFLTEAYAILAHITTLSDLLSGIRKAYLNVDAQTPKFRSPDASKGIGFASGGSLSGLKSLTNEERDQIDLQARLILGQCADRISQLEQLEAARSKRHDPKANPFTKFLPSLLPTALTSSQAYSELIAAHRSNIAWFLTRRLADVGTSQKDMQEERVKRQLERARSLGGTSLGQSGSLGSPNVASSSTASFQVVPPPVTSSSYSTLLLDDSDVDEDEEFELSESQIQQFESENAAILREQESLLASVKQAESRLMEISALQTELVVQLQRQTEIVDTLFDEAVSSQAEVEKGNQQLKQARERAKSSRKWILLFVLFATLALLFLHWYD